MAAYSTLAPVACADQGDSVAAPLSAITVSGTDFRGTPQPVNLKGWEKMAEAFESGGVDRAAIIKAFSDPRMPAREPLLFSLNPKESSYNYRKLNTKINRTAALRCYGANKPYFESAQQKFGVPAEVILSIIQVETGCGANVGNTPVLPRLLRLAAAALPDNIDANIASQGADGLRPEIRAKVVERANYLQSTFLPHAIATFSIASHHGVDLFNLKGSGAGAVGVPQFLPGHYLRFGIDADRNGEVNLYTVPDAVLSVGFYLRNFGWKKPHLSEREKRAVIWEYNRSHPYIDTVLGMAKLLRPQLAKLSAPVSQNRLLKIKQLSQ